MATDTGAERRATRAAARRAALAVGDDALLILCALDDHDHGSGEVFPGLPTLARLTGYGIERVRRRLADLVAVGVLGDTGRRRNNSPVYALPWGPDVNPEPSASPRPAVDQPSPSHRPAIDQPSTPERGSRRLGALEGEGEGEGEGDAPRPERCAMTSCPNRGDFTGPKACRGCKEARQRQDDRAAEASAARQIAVRAASLQDHAFADDGSGLTCTECNLGPKRHAPATVVPTVRERVNA